MPAKSRFVRLDAFTKTVEDARIRTRSGGFVTLASLLVILYLIWGEWYEYRRIVVRPELIVDKGRGERMEIHLNISFPRIPCELLSLDVMDVSGEMQTGIISGVNKVRLSSVQEGSRVIDVKSLNLHADDEQAHHLGPDYCGECYGAPPPPNGQKPGCCNTCEEVREAYASVSWAFGRGENVEQCEREHYGQRLDEQRKEGCRIEGDLRVNRVVGNMHIAPGRSFTSGNMHVHDLQNYFNAPEANMHTFTHKIHHLRFGPQLPDETRRSLSVSTPWTNHHVNPLDDTQQSVEDAAYNFMYFIKVVSTSYLPLGANKKLQKLESRNYDAAPLGAHGFNADGSLETHQFSVTSHKRPLRGGTDINEGHKERVHAGGGIPGVFFSYDISPMKVINREERSKTFAGFLTGIAAVIGGTLTVAAAIDRGVYEGSTRIKKLHQR